MVSVPEVDIRWVVNMVNEFSPVTRAAAGEQQQPYPELGDLAGSAPSLAALGRDHLIAVADEAHTIFARAQRGQAITADINRVLERTHPSPRAGRDSLTWIVTEPDDALAAAVALSLLDFWRTHGQHRLGLCAATRCADVFADTSPAGRRRFCSNICLNRHKVAQHRARARTTSSQHPR